MVNVIDLDRSVMRLAHENFWLDGDDVSTGPGLDGREQVLYTENRRWIGRLDFVRMRPNAIRTAVVVGDRLRGRANLLRLTLCNQWTVRFLDDPAVFYKRVGVSEADLAHGSILFDDSAPFSDDSGFSLPDYSEPITISAVSVGQSKIHLSGYLGRNIAVGAFFSINDYLYRVEENQDGLITFNPPLRAAVLAGVRVDVSRPKILVRLLDGTVWRPFCEYFRNGQPMKLEVTEAFDR